MSCDLLVVVQSKHSVVVAEKKLAYKYSYGKNVWTGQPLLMHLTVLYMQLTSGRTISLSKVNKKSETSNENLTVRDGADVL